MILLKILNLFFFAFHTLFIVFNLTGWYWKRTRRLHMYSLLVTAFFWFIMGIWFGIGYCPCTDWHWQVRMRMGFFDMPPSYVKFLIMKLTGHDLPELWVDVGTFVGWLTALVLSIRLNWSDRPRGKLH